VSSSVASTERAVALSSSTVASAGAEVISGASLTGRTVIVAVAETFVLPSSTVTLTIAVWLAASSSGASYLMVVPEVVFRLPLPVSVQL